MDDVTPSMSHRKREVKDPKSHKHLKLNKKLKSKQIVEEDQMLPIQEKSVMNNREDMKLKGKQIAQEDHILPIPKEYVMHNSRKLALDSEKLKALLALYDVHFKAYSKNRKQTNQLIPCTVWEMLYVDFCEQFPDNTLKRYFLKTELRKALRTRTSSKNEIIEPSSENEDISTNAIIVDDANNPSTSTHDTTTLSTKELPSAKVVRKQKREVDVAATTSTIPSAKVVKKQKREVKMNNETKEEQESKKVVDKKH